MVNIIVNNYMLGKYVFVIFLSLYVMRNFRGTCSSIKMLKGYMVRVSLGTLSLEQRYTTCSPPAACGLR